MEKINACRNSTIMQSYFSPPYSAKMCMILGEGEKTKSPKISHGAFADRTGNVL